jgi:PAS domain-containing protein
MGTTAIEHGAERPGEEDIGKRWHSEEIGLFDINFETGERYWSRELRHIFGIKNDAPAEFSLFLQHVHPEDRRAVNAVAMQPFRSDCPPHNTSEFRVIPGDGAVHWVHVERVAIYRSNATNDVVRVAGFVIEIDPPTKAPGACVSSLN